MTHAATRRTPGAVVRWLDGDLAVRLLKDRYEALAGLRAEKGGGDWFGVRMLGRRALVTRGPDGVREFYDPQLVTRRGAMPAPVRLVLFGPGAVHGLEGDQHSARKALFLGVITPSSVARLTQDVGRRLDAVLEDWQRRSHLRLYDELVTIYGSAALAWAGTGTSGTEAESVSSDLATMVDGFGVGGSFYPRAVLARIRSQRWALGVIRKVRSGRVAAPDGSAVAVLAATPPSQLPDLVAATELLNLVRPTVAVAYFGAYAAQALERRPDWKPDLASGSPAHLRAFEHELRRYYPFVPLLTGRLQRAYAGHGHTLGPRDWMVLDVFGTNRDVDLWDHPDEFRPERFLGREPTAYDYVPQGGGYPTQGHRCPGEPAAVSLLEATLRRLAALDFRLAPEGREVPLGRVPSLPSDHVQLLDVRRAAVPV